MSRKFGWEALDEDNFGGGLDEKTEIEIAEHAVYANLDRLLNSGCVGICGEIHNWLGNELRKRVREAAE